MVYGERDGTLSDRVHALDAALSGAGFGARASTGILQEMWEKWGTAGDDGGVDLPVARYSGEIEAVPGGAELALRFLAEPTGVAAASGYGPREVFLARARGMPTAK